MSAEKSAGVRDGMEAFALTITKTPPNCAGEEQNGVQAALEWPLQTGGSDDHTSFYRQPYFSCHRYAAAPMYHGICTTKGSCQSLRE
jgi:hypothetical protein